MTSPAIATVGPQTVGELAAWMLQRAKDGTVKADIILSAIQLPISDDVEIELKRRALSALFDATLESQRRSAAAAYNRAPLHVENRLDGSVSPLLTRIKFVAANGGRLISGLSASPADWDAHSKMLSSVADGASRKSQAAQAVAKLLRDHKATCAARCPKAAVERIEQLVADAWQHGEGD